MLKKWMKNMNSSYLIVEDAKAATLQDGGRFGYEKFGITINGATDMYAYMISNKILNNFPSTPSIEIMFFDFSIKSEVDIPFCVTGPPAEVLIDNNPVNQWEAHILPGGSTLSVKNIKKGLKTYLSFHGGIESPKVLGSVALDSVAGFGEKLRNGQKIKIETDTKFIRKNDFQFKNFEIPTYGSPWDIRVTNGPDTPQFQEELKNFLGSEYKISPQSNQVGIRLDGPSVAKSNFKEVLSRGVAIGAVQVVPSGQPIILHRGRTLTAGYPVIGTIVSSDLGLIGQARPGDEVRFSYITIKEAEELYKKRFNKLY